MNIKIVTSDRIDYCCECKKEHGYECPLSKNWKDTFIVDDFDQWYKWAYSGKFTREQYNAFAKVLNSHRTAPHWKGRLDKWCDGDINLLDLKLSFALILVILMEVVIINNLL